MSGTSVLRGGDDRGPAPETDNTVGGSGLREYVIHSSGTSAFLLLTDQPVAIAGIVRLSCLAGTVEIHGHKLQAGAASLLIPSLFDGNLAMMYGTGPVMDFEDFVFAAKRSNSLDSRVINECAEKLMDLPYEVRAVVRITATDLGSEPELWSYVDRFPSLLPTVTKEAVKAMRSYFLRTDGVPGDTWERLFPDCYLFSFGSGLLDEGLAYNTECREDVHVELENLTNLTASVVFICGGKRMGKSQLARFVLNRLLEDFPSVQLLDCDVGQSMFNPRGCVAMHTFTQPVLVHNFTSLRKPDSCSYIGENNPVESFDNYRKALDFVYRTGRQRVPLVVNSTGFFQGAGLKSLRRAVHLSKPNLVIELQKTGKPGAAGGLLNSSHPEFLTVYPPQGTVRSLPQVSRRKVRLLAYFGSSLSETGSVRQLELKTTVIYFTADQESRRSKNLNRVVGHCVGLVSSAAVANASKLNDFQYGRLMPTGRCLGFGLVTDLTNGKLSIRTPIPDTDFGLVNVIIHGSLAAPENLFS